MSSDIAISVKNVEKCYEMYDEPHHRLFQTLFRGRKQFYKEFWALQDISFEVKKGECVGIIGRNGCGKSTLLQIIAGTLQATTGSVEVNGRVAALLELGSGFNPEFTGRENVYMNGTVLGLTHKEIDEKFDEIVAFADIGEFIEQPVKIYSSGMMVRLAFAVIAHVNADILIIDEALAVGDVFFVQKCMRFIRKFMKTNTILFVSHDTAAVINLCDHAIMLTHGQVSMAGTPKEVTEQYLVELHESVQGESNIAEKKQDIETSSESKNELRDMRQDFINSTNLRNDIQLFEFNENGVSFGLGGVSIESVLMTDKNYVPLSWVVGGEMVKLKIKTRVLKDVFSPIVGFTVKDRLGQALFADNTYITYMENTIKFNPEDLFVTVFTFIMPVLAVGDYSISCSVAEGSQQEHVQHEWRDDCLIFKSHSSYALALFAPVMREIEVF